MCMKKKLMDIDELIKLKFEYISECHNNASICVTRKSRDKVYKLLKKRYGIVGRDKMVVLKKINNMIKGNKKVN
jgi:hypothetical protein